MKSLACKLMLSLLSLFVVFSCSCSIMKSEPSATIVAAEQPAEPAAVQEEKPAEKPVAEIQKPVQQPVEKPVAQEKKPIEQPVEAAKPAVEMPEDPNIVGKIGDFTINKEDLKQRLLQQFHPYNYDSFSREAKPINTENVLKQMLADKAVIIDARNLGYTEHETVSKPVKDYRDKRLANMLLQQYVQPKLNVTDEEIQERLKADPNQDPARVKAMIQRAQANKIIADYYDQLYQKSNVKKLTENYPKAIEINRKLLKEPVKPRRMEFVHKYQIDEEMTQEERDIVLATYNGGKITVKDWLETLCNYSPPSRPNLDTPKVAEQLLDVALRLPLYVKEAESHGLDKNKDLLEQVKDYEDNVLVNTEVRRIIQEGIETPTYEQIIEFFNKNKKAFGTTDSIKFDVIWCQNLETANKVKAALTEGKDFESVRQEYALNKEGNATMGTNPASEGMFWKDLWAAEPNDIVGPIKGFNRQQINWRVVRILEKTPGKEKEYTEKDFQSVKNRMTSEQLNDALDEYKAELLKKYPYQIYADRIKDVDPLNIP